MNKVLKKLICITLSILVFSMLLVGCSNQNTQTSESPEGENEELTRDNILLGKLVTYCNARSCNKRLTSLKRKGFILTPFQRISMSLLKMAKN